MGSTTGGAGSSLGSGASGGSIDPRPGNLGGDADISKIRGSNIG